MSRDKLNEEQAKYYDILMSGVNAFVTGDAGVGKTYFIKKFIEDSKDAGKNVMVCATTGIAAINIGGVTAHRAFGIPLHPILSNTRVEVTPELVCSDIVILEEVSLCRFDIFGYIAKCIGKANQIRQETFDKKPIQFIVIGDFFQLPPVMNDETRKIFKDHYKVDVGCGFAFQSQYWAKFKFVNCVLKKSMRQNEEQFIFNINLVRRGDVRGLDFFRNFSSRTPIPNAVYLCGTNKKAKEQNDFYFDKLDAIPHKYEAYIIGDVKPSDKMVEDTIELKVGARVMTLVNDKYNKYQNGSLGEIVKCTNDHIWVKLDNGEKVCVERYTWEIMGYTVKDNKLVEEAVGKYSQFPLKVAYAITIHKSQGQTYEKVNLNPYCWDNGQLYVALSRVKTIDGLYLDGYLNDKYLKTANEVIQFYNSL